MAYFQSYAELFQKQSTATRHEEDADVPYRALLLTGPPGVGKSTVCNVIASHWGFHTVEINASRERSEGALAKTLQTVLQAAKNQSIAEGEGKNFLLIEEVDGISPSGLSALTNHGLKSNVPVPIICIANDLYTPTLRTLRQQSVVGVIQFPAVQESRMASRFLRIITSEGLYPSLGPTEKSMLVKRIAATSEGDMRKGLNLLQFAFFPAETDEVEGSALTSTSFHLWKRVFRRGSLEDEATKKLVHVRELAAKLRNFEDLAFSRRRGVRELSELFGHWGLHI